MNVSYQSEKDLDNSSAPSALNQFQAAAVLIGLSVALWICGVVGSSLLIGSDPGTISPSSRGNIPANTESMTITELLSAAEKLLAGNSSQESEMQALELLRVVLIKEPTNRIALREIASLSFEHQVFDKAEDYYRRYLELEPNDEKAQTDFALVLVQLGRAAEGEERLRQILKKNERYFPAQLSLALALNMQQKTEEARAQALKAKSIAPDEKAIMLIDGFIKRLDEPQAATDTPSDAAAAMPALPDSPASAVTRYFQNHPIVGPKIVRMKWLSATELELQLDSFPMEKMPEVIREKFLGSVRKVLADQKEKMSVTLVDASTKAVLVKIE